MEEAKHQNRNLGVGLKTEPALECTEVIQPFVNDRQADDRIDQISIDVNPAKHTE